MSVPQFLISLLVILIAAKIGSEIAERFHLPAVLGELVAGIIVGAGIFAPLSVHFSFLRPIVIHSSSSVLELLGQLGAVLLLFEVGLESDIKELRQLGFLSIWLAIAGATFSFVLGFLACMALGLSMPVSAFVGASITATSVGISVRTLRDLGHAGSAEAKLVLGAAVADDVLGLIVLAIVISITTVGRVSLISVGRISLTAIIFLIGAIVIGTWLTPFVLRFADRMRSRAALPTVALCICLYFALLATNVGGLSPIIGAFAAGLVLSQSEHRLQLQRRLRPVADVFIPVFFVIVGAAMSLTILNPASPSGRYLLLIAFVLTAAAIAAKVLAGTTVPARLDRLVVGCGMTPRGEVSLIFASYGIRSHLIGENLYSAILVVIMLTTFLTPPSIKFALRRQYKNKPSNGSAVVSAQQAEKNVDEGALEARTFAGPWAAKLLSRKELGNIGLGFAALRQRK